MYRVNRVSIVLICIMISFSVFAKDKEEKAEAKINHMLKSSDVLPTIDGDDVIPPMPEQSANDRTLLGIDMDADGIRDDLEIWANKITNDVGIRKALKQNLKYSRLASQYADDPKKVKIFLQKATNGTRCLSYLITKGITGIEAVRKHSLAAKLVKEMSTLEYNTQSRILTELKTRKYIGELDRTSDASTNCEF